MENKKDTRLTHKERKFVAEYLKNGYNSTRAYMAVQPTATYDTARSKGCLWVAKDNIRAAIKKEVDSIVAECRDTVHRRVMEIWTMRAFYDPSDIIGPDGDLVDSMDELKAKGLTVCIDQFCKSLDKEGNEHIEYKLADRDKAVEQLRKFLSLGSGLMPQIIPTAGTSSGDDPEESPKEIFVTQKVSPEDWAAFINSTR